MLTLFVFIFNYYERNDCVNLELIYCYIYTFLRFFHSFVTTLEKEFMCTLHCP